MKADLSRRRVLQGAAAGSALWALPSWATDSPSAALQRIEREYGITLGVFALDTGSGRQLAYRAEQRLPMCSTFKVMLAGAVLQRSQREPHLLARVVRYPASALVVYSPVTERHVERGMRVAELCAAALQYSDNTAANLLLEVLGGPAELTAFARRLGDPVFRLDRIEPALNSALPDDPRDTSSAQALALSLQRLALGTALEDVSRVQLQAWLKGNTTGAKRIRAGVPAGWTVGDKTGSGDYGVANDLALLWPPQRAPWVLAVLSRSAEAKAPWRDAALAETTRIVVAALA